MHKLYTVALALIHDAKAVMAGIVTAGVTEVAAQAAQTQATAINPCTGLAKYQVFFNALVAGLATVAYKGIGGRVRARRARRTKRKVKGDSNNGS